MNGAHSAVPIEAPPYVVVVDEDAAGFEADSEAAGLDEDSAAAGLAAESLDDGFASADPAAAVSAGLESDEPEAALGA